MTEERKMRVFSGIQPSGDIHIGNYLGAIKKWVDLIETHDSIFCIVDDHAITVDYEAKKLPERTFEAATAVMACGLDPSLDNCTLFVQSHVPAHTELTWLFNTITPLGSLFRMTQFKEKSRNALAKVLSRESGEAPSTILHDLKNTGLQTVKTISELRPRIEALAPEADEVDEELLAALNDGLGSVMQGLQVGLGVSAASTGLFDYPVLQAADILLYRASLVPVGEDQEQHLELCREIAQRFNKRFKKRIFPMAQRVPGEAPRIMGLDGRQKMSKSLNNHIGVLDPPKLVEKKIMGAFTDPQRVRLEDPGRPEVCNIHRLHRFFSSPEQVAELDEGCRKAAIGCGECKKILAVNMNAALSPIRERAQHLKEHPAEVVDALERGAKRCRELAAQTMEDVHAAMGIGPKALGRFLK